jgi:hypothetical protein
MVVVSILKVSGVPFCLHVHVAAPPETDAVTSHRSLAARVMATDKLTDVKVPGRIASTGRDAGALNPNTNERAHVGARPNYCEGVRRLDQTSVVNVVSERAGVAV